MGLCGISTAAGTVLTGVLRAHAVVVVVVVIVQSSRCCCLGDRFRAGQANEARAAVGKQIIKPNTVSVPMVSQLGLGRSQVVLWRTVATGGPTQRWLAVDSDEVMTLEVTDVVTLATLQIGPH